MTGSSNLIRQALVIIMVVNLRCGVPECQFATGDKSENVAIAMLNNHNLAHQPGPRPGAEAPRAPRLERPKVDVGVSAEEWTIFDRRWDVFRTGSGIDDASAAAHLFQCAEATLSDSLLRAHPTITSRPVAEVLEAMRALAVVPVATCVLRAELLSLRQERDETFRAFAARVRGKAETCEFRAMCSCKKSVDYTDHVIVDVLLSGINDPDIRRDVLGSDSVLSKSVNDVIALVENKEMARNALPNASLSAVSSFRRQTRTAPGPSGPDPRPSDRTQRSPCPECGQLYDLFSEGARGWNTRPHRMCINCFRLQRQKKKVRPTASSATASSVQVSEQTDSVVAQVTANHTSAPAPPLDHHVFSDGSWRRANLQAHPRVRVQVQLDETPSGTDTLPSLSIDAVADSGAQSDLLSLDEFLAAGFQRASLRPVALDVSAANRSPIPVEGAFLSRITGRSPRGDAVTCRSMVYVSSAVRGMYLSHSSMMGLGIVGCEFPVVGVVGQQPEREVSSGVAGGDRLGRGTSSLHAVRGLGSGCVNPPASSSHPCSCPQRTAPPSRPSELPFAPVRENNDRMKKWLLARYATSTFNTCPHRPLSCMDGPPVEIHVDPSATPRAVHTPAAVALHWQQRVYEDLLRDEALGVIERVPYGEPVDWCHRMVVTRKHDGSPRRTVDLSPLNRFCKRETFAADTPFQLARRIPKGTWKTVTDAWNGYHSVPLREADRHLTTFITPFGRWRYTRAPQGFLSSGDGYNRRFDAVLAGFPRKERCVDDTVHYDDDLETHWWRTIDLLTRLGRAGIVLNPDKFQFAQRDVEFAGFRIAETTITPMSKYLDAIRTFPTPQSTTDIRSWFGLVNQVANYAQLRDVMKPFKSFLSPKQKFFWSAELESAFTRSKELILSAIREGVEIFDLSKRTCLRPDWSSRGIGYFLLQQHCSCPSGVPGCCDDGWKVTLAGSRFLTSAEQRYAAVEGEALAIAWGLEQTRYFTQGCDNLVVVTDHKPLVRIFGDRTLDEITNTRLFRLKQRTLPWRFEVEYLPGATNLAADAASRHPSHPAAAVEGETGITDHVEAVLAAAIQRDAREVVAISWDELAKESSRDRTMSAVLRLIETGFPEESALAGDAAPFWAVRDALYTQDGVVLYQDRVVVPSALRHRVLQSLHAAHQGVGSMERRARAIVFWPGMTADIQDTRDRCRTCIRNAPSQAATPPLSSPPPSTPFEQVFADFFQYAGRHYLAVGDRLSGWVEIFGSPSGTVFAGASGLIKHLRAFFARFGVPEELSSDGGPEFSAAATADFLRQWGVRHRVSSAYFPQSNGRAEVAVKTAKRLLASSTDPTGSLDNDRFLRAMLQLRNTPDPDCQISPAQIVFGRPIRDAFAFVNRLEKFSSHHIRPVWREAWAAKEAAMRTRMTRTVESLSEHCRPLPPLSVGDRVFLQNQVGNSPKKWDRSGTVVECSGHDQYVVKVDGSGRLTTRNRRFVRTFCPVSTSLPAPTPAREVPAADTPKPASPLASRPDIPAVVPPAPRPPRPGLPTCPPPVNSGDFPPLVAPASVPRPSSPPGPASPPGLTADEADAVGPPAEHTTKNPDTTDESQPVIAPSSPRPQRRRVPRRYYEPETGSWVPYK